jgi:hypothetical protein
METAAVDAVTLSRNIEYLAIEKRCPNGSGSTEWSL